MTTMRGTLFIVAAPSGAGKSSIVNACLARDPNICLSISFTSRAPRPGERHAEHYNFVSAQEFERMVAAGDFFEHDESSRRLVERQDVIIPPIGVKPRPHRLPGSVAEQPGVAKVMLTSIVFGA